MNPQQAKIAYESYTPPPTPTPAQVEAFLETFGFSRTGEDDEGGWVTVQKGLDFVMIPQKVQARDFRRAMWGCVDDILIQLEGFNVPPDVLFEVLSRIDVSSQS